MNLFDVYPLYDLEPVKAEGCYIWDQAGHRYLDLYGGHAVISIGHNHPEYVRKLQEQLHKIVFYSNSVKNSMQAELADKLGLASGYTDYSLFLCNSGTEANENALKLASFYNNRKKVVAFKKAFHGRTSASVAVTDNPNITAPINRGLEVVFLPLNDLNLLEEELKRKDVSSLIIEGIQGVGGINIPDPAFLKSASQLCEKYDVVFILDEIQSGYGRSGKFFAHQHAGIRPDIITTAKGMGNGFPIGGVLISPKFAPKHGMLGTTFGGNYLACAAGISVLDVLKKENLVENAAVVGQYIMNNLAGIDKIKAVRGKGLMIGIEFDFPITSLRKELLFTHKVFTGVTGTNMIRLLSPLCLSKEQADTFIVALKKALKEL
jgi:acetylornithine/N-succinyldiaminopimelate aminotransferase